MNVLIMDGSQRSALAMTRSLGRRGARVWIGEEHGRSLAAASRYCVREIVYPSPYRDPDAFERFLLRFVERETVDVVLPASDVTTHAVARNADALRPFTATPAPPFESFEVVTDKWCLLNRAVEQNIPVPETRLVEGKGRLAEHLGRIEFPVVVKPTRSRIRINDGWTSGVAQYAANEAELLRIYGQTSYLASAPSLIQERIVGPGLGVFVLCDRGKVVATFAHTRMREMPPTGGVSVLCESAACDPQLQEQAIGLLEPLRWHGVAMLEYKLDLRRRQAVLMEVNGRFWGSLQLAIDAGVDFPYLACRLALGQPLELPVPYRIGMRNRWTLGDLDHLLWRLRHNRRDLHDGTPSRWRAVVEFIAASRPAVRSEILRPDDLGPALRELCQYLTPLFPSAIRSRRLVVPRNFGLLSRTQR
jgi:predicted ATP-grasp superfamily ATP-dependent carboligase